MSDWNVYMIQSSSDDSLYTGIATNVVARLSRHNNGTGAKRTRGRGPWHIVWTQIVGTKSDALSMEHQIKSMSRQRKLELVLSRGLL